MQEDRLWQDKTGNDLEGEWQEMTGYSIFSWRKKKSVNHKDAKMIEEDLEKTIYSQTCNNKHKSRQSPHS